MGANILFLGTPDFAVPTLEALIADPRVAVKAVITQPDKPSGRGHKVTPPPVKLLADQHGIPVLQPGSVRKEFTEISARLAPLGPFDLGVVVAFGQILPLSLLQLPRRGCVNVHGSLLPRWRGAAPMQRAIMMGDNETGICLMQMDEGLDTGAVYAEKRVPLSDSDTLGSLHDRLAHLGATALIDHLDGILSGSLSAKAQPTEGVTYAHKIKAEEALVHWNQDASTIGAGIRGLSPFPGAFTFLNGLRLKLFMCSVSPSPLETPRSPPGTVIAVETAGITVACGTGYLTITELQLEGKKRMDAATFIRGTSLSKGQILQSSKP